MKKILVPTDFSPQAEHALKVAVEIAMKGDAELYLLHSVEMPMHLANSGDSGSLPEAVYFIKLAEKKFETLLKEPYLSTVVLHEAIGHGEIYNDIKETVATNDIDLIVMGSHGASGFKEMFIGSNTEKVVRTSDIPVLVIKNEHSAFEVADFVFATDFTEECHEPFEAARSFAQFAGAKMHLLYVNTPSGFKTTSEIYALMRKFVKHVPEKEYTLNIYNDYSVEKGILSFARDHEAQLIGISTHGRKGLSHFFNGSISEDMVNHAKMPVITFKIP